MPGWSLRDLFDAIRAVVGGIDVALGSTVGLLTVAAWRRHDAAPFVTLAYVARWLGLNIGDNLADANDWLNAPHRHGIFVSACHWIFFVALIVETFSAANNVELREWVAIELRFWSTVWILTGVLFQLDALSWQQVAIGLLALYATRVLQAASIISDLGASMIPAGAFLTVVAASGSLLALPWHVVKTLARAAPANRGETHSD
jgi:hypothetical protein